MAIVAYWAANINRNMEPYPVQTRVFSLSQLVLFFSLAPPACVFSPAISSSDNIMIVATSDACSSV
jgi:hypothetical protein